MVVPRFEELVTEDKLPLRGAFSLSPDNCLPPLGTYAYIKKAGDGLLLGENIMRRRWCSAFFMPPYCKALHGK